MQRIFFSCDRRMEETDPIGALVVNEEICSFGGWSEVKKRETQPVPMGSERGGDGSLDGRHQSEVGGKEKWTGQEGAGGDGIPCYSNRKTYKIHIILLLL